MQFPSFHTTGPTRDLQTIPLQHQPMNLLPLIDIMQRQQKAPKSASVSDPSGGDDKFKIAGTIGQIQQWQGLNDEIDNKIKAGMAYYGADVFTSMPEYRQLVNDKSRYQSLEMVNTAKVNKERIDAYDASVKENNASGQIHLGQGFRGGGFYSHADLTQMQQYAHTKEIGRTGKDKKEWEQNYEWSPTFYDMSDAEAEMSKIYTGLGFSEEGRKSGGETIQERILGSTLGVMQDYNSSFRDAKSNYNIHGENPENMPGGQLAHANKEAWQRAGASVDLTDPLSAGLLQGFAQRTTGISPYENDKTGKEALSDRKQAFYNVYNPERSKAEMEAINKDHDGYYFKKGHEREGELDIDLFQEDYIAHANRLTDAVFNKNKEDSVKTGNDNKKTFTASPEPAYKAMGAAKEVDLFMQAAQQLDNSIATKENQGFTINELGSYIDADGNKKSAFDRILGGDISPDIFFGATAAGEVGKDAVLNLLTTQGELSPLMAKVGSDGQMRYTASDAFNTQKLHDKVMQNQLDAGASEEEAANYANKAVQAATKAYNTVREQQTSEGYYGDTRSVLVAYQWTPDQAPKDLMAQIKSGYFPEEKDAMGNIMYKSASESLVGVPVHVGETVAEGATLFGPAKMKNYTGDITLKAVAIPRNAGAVAQQDITIGGRDYRKGQFIHMSQFDAIPSADMNKLRSTSAVNFGTGYWNNIDNSKTAPTDGAAPDMTRVSGMGKNSEAILTEIGTTGPNAPRNAPAKFHTSVQYENDDKEQRKYWKDNNITMKIEAPAYTDDKVGIKWYDEASKKVGGAGTPESNADALGLTGKLREDYIAKVKVIQKAVTGSENTDLVSNGINVLSLSGKYIAAQNGVDTRHWKVEPTLMDVPIVGLDGNVGEQHKKQLGYVVNDKGQANWSATTDVTGAMIGANADKTRPIFQAGIDLHARGVQKRQGEEKDKANNTTGTTRTVVPIVPTTKPQR